MTAPKVPTKAEIEMILKKPLNFMSLEFGYSDEWVVPYADGVAIMEHFKHAEAIKGYGDKKKIQPVKDYPRMHVMSKEEYVQLKFKHLMEPTDADD